MPSWFILYVRMRGVVERLRAAAATFPLLLLRASQMMSFS